MAWTLTSSLIGMDQVSRAPTARARSVTANFNLFGLGVIRNSDIDVITGLPGAAYPSFGGVPVSADDVLLKYTYLGDGNLDGLVSFDDYVGMDNAFFGLIPNLGWATGDVTFYNAINFDDYSKVDQAFFFQGAPLAVGWAEFDEAHAEPDFSLAQAFTPGAGLSSVSNFEEPLQGPNAPPVVVRIPAQIASSQFESRPPVGSVLQAADSLADARLSVTRRSYMRDLWDDALLGFLDWMLYGTPAA